MWYFPATITTRSAQKNGGVRRGGLPVGVVGVSSSLLERETQSKRQEPHRRVVFDVGDSSGIGPGAIDTSIALGVVKAHHRVVKDVVGIHAELALEALGEAEVLREREIRSKEMRSTE